MLLVSCDIPEEMRARLPEHTVTAPCGSLPRACAAHPDMLAHRAPDRVIASGAAHALVPGSVCGELTQQPVYPFDIPYNCFYICDTLICNEKYTDPVILDYYKSRGMKTAAVKQGYAACSTLKISDSAAITSDRGIAEAIASAGGDALLIQPGHVRLDGYGYGFIGGAGGITGDGRVALFGSLSLHPDARRILGFAAAHKVELEFLCEGGLYDYGGIISF